MRGVCMVTREMERIKGSRGRKWEKGERERERETVRGMGESGKSGRDSVSGGNERKEMESEKTY